MDEAQVKAATLNYVRKMNGRRRKPVVTAEFSLGSSGVRADLVVFADTVIGFEIKTARDSLRRLPSQMHAYARYFDHAVAIVAPSHLKNLKFDDLQGASLWTYDKRGDVTVLHVGNQNNVGPDALLDVLTQSERRKRHYAEAMIARYGPTSRQFWDTVGRRAICAEDLPLLSRFSESRDQAKRWASHRKDRWSHWLAAQDALVAASA
ncbi:sce7726 family protein [Sphingopyxis sp. KK2]|uniref:sce7726 family protein n=1 Tax=Sphingopyxis sp. KK2 TaxID=1855727 RepID=UPI00097E6835|nr:sce7726 family protein [Sphingopyxis sp. KK2]